ncbi:MAG TPA: hypothetical protein VMX17_06855, partial [Candidatus Glassbacteria bacterium]|nr:hypothetical protein [Candidatus Glassbacteria bacterium]
FVVGDAKGTDRMAHLFLNKQKANVTVYHMFNYPRNNCSFPTMGGFTTDNERDAAMTAISTNDIAWVRSGREKSGTAKNLRRRKNENK